MLSLVISGCNGYMGRVVASIAANDPDIIIAAGIDISAQQNEKFPVYITPADYSGTADVIIDFSNPSALDSLLVYGLMNNIPLVLCTTGYSPEQLSAISSAAEQIPIFRSGNMSLGINILSDLVKRACAILGNSFDVEIVERHHRRKMDSPSGTAIMLAETAAAALPYSPEYIYERQSRRSPRESNEIGISSIRGGTIVGEHSVIFAGLDEVIELKHSAASRDVFAAGAIRAAKFIVTVEKPGLYNMSDMLSRY